MSAIRLAWKRDKIVPSVPAPDRRQRRRDNNNAFERISSGTGTGCTREAPEPALESTKMAAKSRPEARKNTRGRSNKANPEGKMRTNPI